LSLPSNLFAHEFQVFNLGFWLPADNRHEQIAK